MPSGVTKGRRNCQNPWHPWSQVQSSKRLQWLIRAGVGLSKAASMALSRLPAAVRRSAVGELGARKCCGPVAPAEPLGWVWEDACVDCNMKSDSKEPDSEYEPNYSTHFITYSQGDVIKICNSSKRFQDVWNKHFLWWESFVSHLNGQWFFS